MYECKTLRIIYDDECYFLFSMRHRMFITELLTERVLITVFLLLMSFVVFFEQR